MSDTQHLFGAMIIKPDEREEGSRRMGLPVDYPLTDSQGVIVIQDRRRLPDRRKTKHNRRILKVMLSKIVSD
ncbi:MAG: hypothetical protein ABFS24_00690 [Pseudomonadota bacterium]